MTRQPSFSPRFPVSMQATYWHRGLRTQVNVCRDFHTVSKACVKKGVHGVISWDYRLPALFSFSKLHIKLCGDVRAGGLVFTLAAGFLFSHSVVSCSLRHRGLRHTSLPRPSPSPGAAQTHVHWVDAATQLSCPLSSPSPPALNCSQHQGLCKWVSCSHQVAKVLELQLQHQSFQWIFKTDLL